MNGNGRVTDAERIFRFLRRVNRQKDVEVVLKRLPQGILGQCIVRIELDLCQIEKVGDDRTALLIHEIEHGLHFGAHEWAIRRRTKRRFSKISARDKKRLDNFLVRCGAPKDV